MNSKIVQTGICVLVLSAILLSPAELLRAEVYSGIAGDESKYFFDTEEKIIRIEGTGAIDGFPYGEEEFSDIPDMHLVVGEGITQIDSFRCPTAYVKTIHLPVSLKTIGDYAFSGCSRLESIVIPSGVEKIGKTVFGYCPRLKTITNYSSEDVYLPSHPDCCDSDKSLYDYYVDGDISQTVPSGKTAIGKAKKRRVVMDSSGGTLSYMYYRFGEPLNPPSIKKKGHVFCGWTTKEHTNYAWYNITNEDTGNPHNTTFFWWGQVRLYAQFAKIETQKPGRGKLKLGLSKWRDAGKLEIQYSTNKKFKNHKTIIVKQGQLSDLWPYAKKYKKGAYKLFYKKSKRMLTVTFNKLKPKKKYYFRFRYSGNDPLNEDETVYSVGDWFKKSIKM